MISTYHNDLLRKLAKRYQVPSGNHNILIYSEWQQWRRQGGLNPSNDLKDHPCEKMKSEKKLRRGGDDYSAILKSKIFFCKISPAKCRKSHLRYSRFQNFPGGACPRTPLGLLGLRRSHFAPPKL